MSGKIIPFPKPAGRSSRSLGSGSNSAQILPFTGRFCWIDECPDGAQLPVVLGVDVGCADGDFSVWVSFQNGEFKVVDLSEIESDD